jgi:8-oxo-dGTP pyrophosphatase MutT (NUDIX family)
VQLDDGGRVLLLWRHRFLADKWGWEIPGGLIDEDKEPADTAIRELEEGDAKPGADSAEEQPRAGP